MPASLPSDVPRVPVPQGPVRSLDGVPGRVVGQDADGAVRVRLDDGRQALVPVELFDQADAGGVVFRCAVGAPPQGAAEAAPQVIPVIEEQLEVHKRATVGGGVRISKTLSERQETIDEPLLRERVAVERVALNRALRADALPTVRQEGETLVIPLIEEVIVVEKRFVLTEEVRVTRVREEIHAPQTVTLRREEVSIERIDEAGRAPAP